MSYPAHNLAAQLVALMPGWTVNLPGDDCEWADMVRESDGGTVRIRWGGYRCEGRVTFMGMWPRFRDGTHYSGGKYESITCSNSRTTGALAKDIVRRLLPAYDVAYEKARVYVQDHDANEVEAEAVASRVAGSIGSVVGKSQYRRGDGVPIHHEPECVRRLVIQPAYKSLSFERPMTVNFEVHGLDPDTAAAVLQLIRASEGQRIATAVRVAEPVFESEEEHESVRELRAKAVG